MLYSTHNLFNTANIIVHIQAVLGLRRSRLTLFEVTNATHKNIKDNNIEAVKLDYCDQELQ